MLLIVFVLCLLLMYIGFYCTRSLFSPLVLISGLWGIITGLFFIFGDQLYPVTGKFPLAILLWIVCFYIGAFYADLKSIPFHLALERKGDPNVSILKLYYIIVCITTPVIVLMTLLSALNGPTGNLLYDLRFGNIGAFKLGFWGYFVSLAFVTYLIELAYYSVQNRKRVFILLILNLFLAIITVSKFSFFSILFSSVVILYYRRKIRFQKILFLFLFFLLFSIVLQWSRSLSGSIAIKEFLVTYLLSGAVAFDYLADGVIGTDLGTNTFRFFYAVADAFGANVGVNNTILDFVNIPLPTNVYTVLYPFYVDFGWIGIILFALFSGLFYGFVHRQIREGENSFLVIYAIFATYIVMQFMGEFLATNLSNTIQYLFYTILPFIVKKEISWRWR